MRRKQREWAKGDFSPCDFLKDGHRASLRKLKFYNLNQPMNKVSLKSWSVMSNCLFISTSMTQVTESFRFSLPARLSWVGQATHFTHLYWESVIFQFVCTSTNIRSYILYVRTTHTYIHACSLKCCTARSLFCFVFCGVTPSSVVEMYQRFVWNCCLHLRD
jgi:hypothetical protein